MKTKKIIKRIFCNHIYKYAEINKGKKPIGIMPYAVKRCVKCGKEKITKIPLIDEKVLNELIDYSNRNTDLISDGYHTFGELYEFRKIYNAVLFNEWGRYDIPKYEVHKSKRHFNGEECFGGGWFIVIANLPSGQISNHYQLKDWDLFQIPEFEKAQIPFDNHTSSDVLMRLKDIIWF